MMPAKSKDQDVERQPERLEKSNAKSIDKETEDAPNSTYKEGESGCLAFGLGIMLSL